jgi:hypothetical protein
MAQEDMRITNRNKPNRLALLILMLLQTPMRVDENPSALTSACEFGQVVHEL